MKAIILLILLYNINLSYQLNIDLFNHWQCIGIKENINLRKPHKVNIGELPLVLWQNPNTKKLHTSINICKHMGSRLDNGIITCNGNLKCRYHGLEYTEDDIFGETIEHEGKIFWSHKPINKKPFSLPFYNDKSYVRSFIEIDMECSLLNSVYNTMDLRHPEFVHSKIVGFGNSIPPQNIKHYIYKDRVGLAFDYSTNQLMKSINNNAIVTKNYHMFIYPTFSWSKVSFDKNKNLIIGVNLLPIGPKKTRWYITISHNYFTDPIKKKFMKIMAMTILGQDFLQMMNQQDESLLKKNILFNHVFPDEDVMLELKEKFKDYQYPDIEICTNLYQNK